MLEVQKYLLSGKTLEDLKAEFGIKASQHPIDPLVILNYDQIESPKMYPIVRECRGLVLEIGTWKIVAKAFDRFFNLGEALEITKDFVVEESDAYSKEDGSLILFYYYNGWRVNTRGSFAELNKHECGKTWAELFFDCWPKHVQLEYLNQEHTYVFEFCSIYNKIVRAYKEPSIFLLAIFKDGQEQVETAEFYVHNFKRPARFVFKNIEDMYALLNKQEEIDPTFEGFAVRDKNGLRVKVKSKTYVALHQLKGNDNIFLPKNLVPFILAGELDEVLTYFPEVEEKMLEVKAKIDKAYKDLHEVWWNGQDYPEQKGFAIYITKDSPVKTPFTGILFNLRKEYGRVQTEDQLKDVWRNNAEGIIKHLF